MLGQAETRPACAERPAICHGHLAKIELGDGGFLALSDKDATEDCSSSLARVV